MAQYDGWGSDNVELELRNGDWPGQQEAIRPIARRDRE